MLPAIRRITSTQRILLIFSLVLVISYCFYLIHHAAPGEYRDRPEQEEEEKPKELVYIADEDKVLFVQSRRGVNKTYNRVDGVGIDNDLFNPALVELPKGSKHEFMVIARVNHVETEIEGAFYRLAKQVAFFADLFTDKEGVVSLRRSSSARTILDGEFANPPQHKCKGADGVKWNVDRYIGPEDTRIYWTNAGAPLLQYTTQVDAKDECQGIYIVDARAVIPELVDAFGDLAAKLPPIEIAKPRHVRRPRPSESSEEDIRRFEREKNWAPFQYPPFSGDDSQNGSSSDLLFHMQPYEQRVYRFMPKEEFVAPVYEPNPTETNSCFDDRMHQATPLLSLTLCKRGECEPTVHNTVLIGVIQKLRVTPFYKWYQGHVVTWNATEPFAYRSVSKRISYSGMEEGKYAWTCGLVYQWNTTAVPTNRSHGFLDDWMLLTFGMTDHGAGWVSVQADELLRNHVTCTA